MIDLTKNPLCYVTRDLERASGLPLGTPGYVVITNNIHLTHSSIPSHTHPLAHPSIHGIDSDRLLDTWELLAHPDTEAFLKKHHISTIVVFKNTTKIERIAQERGWLLLNPSALLAQQVEEKISQVTWLNELQKYLPPHSIMLCKDIVWNNTPFILQFNRAHTGTGTHFISNKDALNKLQTTFPDRPTRVTTYIHGPVFTANNTVTTDRVIGGNISYQITGIPPFTHNDFATIGNDWGLPQHLLSAEQKQQFEQIVTDVGNKLRKDGWKGLFGVDIICDEATGKLYLLEINARQPASTSFESHLQHETSDAGHTTFDAHLLALLEDAPSSILPIHTGAQIILRVPKPGVTYDLSRIETLLLSLPVHTIRYTNTEPGTDLLRIQTNQTLMAEHGSLNDLGKRISHIIDQSII